MNGGESIEMPTLIWGHAEDFSLCYFNVHPSTIESFVEFSGGAVAYQHTSQSSV